MSDPVRVLVLRGHQATPWELRQWEALPARFAVRVPVTRANRYDLAGVALERVPVRSRRERLPPGTPGDLLATLVGDAYREDLEPHLAWADVVHAEELSYWFAADAARRKARHRYRLVLTVWETIPMGRAYRNRAARRFRSEVLASADAFLATTERARDALLLEGADPARVEVCAPGIDTARFAAARPAAAPEEHLLISPGRLVWEKGHQDVIRALALIARRGRRAPRLLVVGAGPEGARLRAHADELGVGERVEIVAGVPYAEMPGLYARASALVLMSLPRAGADLLVGTPRVFWEEQFGLVLAEAMAAGLPVLAAASGAIPEVLAGAATLVEPGDWRGLADALLAGPLAAAPGTRAAHPPALVRRYSLDGAAARLAAAYDAVLARGSVAG